MGCPAVGVLVLCAFIAIKKRNVIKRRIQQVYSNNNQSELLIDEGVTFICFYPYLHLVV